MGGDRVLPVGRATVHSAPTSAVRLPQSSHDCPAVKKPRAAYRRPLLAAPARLRGPQERIPAANVHAAAAPADRVDVVGLVSAEAVPEQRRRRTLRDLNAGAAI